MTNDRLRPVRVWLYVLATAILLMVAVGGMTRLTDSGLSITSWKPISGVVPPLSDADWQAEFEAYQQIPEYQIENRWMSLEDFKGIFWWEWGHRQLGRAIGVLFLIPFMVFLVQKRLSWRLAPALAVLFVLGGFQGFLGWWMVASGLTERTDVSQYRLAAHLAAAALLFAAIVWVARALRRPATEPAMVPGRRWRVAIWFLALLIFAQIVLGAFVAGLDAGFGYNTWPLMEGAWIPAGLAALDPWWKNLFENTLTVQFDHRVLAYLIVVYTVLIALFGWSGIRTRRHLALTLIVALVLVQSTIGILTLLWVVPIHLAVTHQVVAFVLFGAVVAYASDLRRLAVR